MYNIYELIVNLIMKGIINIMPGYTIHLAVGKVFSETNNIKDEEKLREFLEGIIAPDGVQDKSTTHYGPYSSQPDLNRFIKENGVKNYYDLGYFLHLATDHLFYNMFLRYWLNHRFEEAIYDDYCKLNNKLINRYGLTIPENIKNKITTKDGEPEILDEKQICRFIEAVGGIPFKSILLEIASLLDTEPSIDVNRRIANEFYREIGGEENSSAKEL